MTTNIDENIKSFRQIYSDCSDIKMQEMYLGRDASIKCFVAYIEVTCAYPVSITVHLDDLPHTLKG